MVGAMVLAAALAGTAAWAGIRSPPAAVLRRRLGFCDGTTTPGAVVPVVSDLRPVFRPGVPAPLRGRWAWTRWVGRRRGREVADRRAGTIELCVAVADELRSGRLPTDALLASVQSGGRLVPHAVEAIRHGRPVAPALMRDAEHPGSEGLRLAAACWSVAEQHGGALATALDRVASTLRAQELARSRVALELAAPRATARLLAALPVLGIVIGSASGANPVGVLIGTAWGWGLLGAGLVLDLAGLAWVGRIAHAAERSG
jgi:tight adherence protein B